MTMRRCLRCLLPILLLLMPLASEGQVFASVEVPDSISDAIDFLPQREYADASIHFAWSDDERFSLRRFIAPLSGDPANASV